MLVKAVALGWHSDEAPPRVEVSVRDARGQDHRIVEQVSVLTPHEITTLSRFPIDFWIEAAVDRVCGDEIVVTLPHGVLTTEGRASLVIAPADDDRARYDNDMRCLLYTVHELPAGVLATAGVATADDCAVLMDDLNEFASVCRRLGLDDHDEFIEACRWHFDHYPHYLSRMRHFAGYASYIRDRCGPMRVELPPRPLWAQWR